MSLAGFPAKKMTFTYSDSTQGDIIETPYFFHSAATKVAGYESKCRSRQRNE